MAGGNGITMKVSAALRKAKLGVARYGSTGWAPTRCQSVKTDQCYVSIALTGQDGKDHADAIEAVLLTRGFLYERITGRDGRQRVWYGFNVFASKDSQGYKFYLRVRAAKRELQGLSAEPQAAPLTPADSEQAVVAACGLDVAKLMQNCWAVRHGGQRNAYTIKRTGTGDRARYAIEAKGRLLDKGLRTLAEALAAIQTDIDTQEA